MKRQIKNKAIDIIQQHLKKKNYLKKCYQAEICPTCGNQLKLHHEKELISIDLGSINIFGYRWPKPEVHTYINTTVICPKNHPLPSPWDFNRLVHNIGSIAWFYSIGTIGRAHKNIIDFDKEP